MVSAEADILNLLTLFMFKKIVSIRSRMEALLFAHPILLSKIQELQRAHLRDSQLNSGHLCFMTEGML